MEKREMSRYLSVLLEKHVPMFFCEDITVKQIIALFCSQERSRREILMFAYSIGASVEETNNLLEMAGYLKLYVKIYEDAAWYFSLRKNEDLRTVIHHFFPQNVDET